MLSCPFMLRNVLHLDGHILESAQGCTKCIAEGLGKIFQLMQVIVGQWVLQLVHLNEIKCSLHGIKKTSNHCLDAPWQVDICDFFKDFQLYVDFGLTCPLTDSLLR
jgi:hypothetical protein